MSKGDNLSRNGSGYYDPTAYQAIKNVMADELEESDRFHNPDGFESELNTKMSTNKLQGLRCKIATVDEWLSEDIREDVIGAIEQNDI